MLWALIKGFAWTTRRIGQNRPNQSSQSVCLWRLSWRLSTAKNGKSSGKGETFLIFGRLNKDFPQWAVFIYHYWWRFWDFYLSCIRKKGFACMCLRCFLSHPWLSWHLSTAKRCKSSGKSETFLIFGRLNKNFTQWAVFIYYIWSRLQDLYIIRGFTKLGIKVL